jgi:hypothetical protein
MWHQDRGILFGTIRKISFVDNCIIRECFSYRTYWPKKVTRREMILLPETATEKMV